MPPKYKAPIYQGPPTTLKPKQLMELNKRRAENKEIFERSLADTRAAETMAHWEEHSTRLIKGRLEEDRAANLEKNFQSTLVNRRRKLANLYNNEWNSWETELRGKVETGEERKAKLKERAYALKKRNEDERQRFVKECYDRRWRLANDDARLLDGKALTKFCANDRVNQIRLKEERKKQEKEAEGIFYDKIMEYVTKMQAIEDANKEHKEKMRLECASSLKKQIETNHARKIAHFEQVLKDDEDELDRLAKEIQMEKKELEEKKKAAYEAGKQTRLFNETRFGIREEQKALERKQDLELLGYALTKEREEIEAEQAKAEQAKNEARAYQAYLKDLMIKEAQDNTQIDKIRKEQENIVWEKRDAQQRAQKEARERLAKICHEGRQEQIRLKKIRDAEDGIIEKEMVKKFLQDIEDGKKMDEQKLIKAKEANMKNLVYLRKQIEEKKQKMSLEKQEEYLNHKHMILEEEEHKKRQREQAGKVKLHYPVPHSKWYS